MADNHHVQIMGTQASCGVLQLSGLTSDPDKILYALAAYLYHPSRGNPAAFVMWSDTDESNGIKLFEAIASRFEDNDLTETDWAENPKTSNMIKVFLWQIPHEEFKAWYIEQRVIRAKQL